MWLSSEVNQGSEVSFLQHRSIELNHLENWCHCAQVFSPISWIESHQLVTMSALLPSTPKKKKKNHVPCPRAYQVCCGWLDQVFDHWSLLAQIYLIIDPLNINVNSAQVLTYLILPCTSHHHRAAKGPLWFGLPEHLWPTFYLLCATCKGVQPHFVFWQTSTFVFVLFCFFKSMTVGLSASWVKVTWPSVLKDI